MLHSVFAAALDIYFIPLVGGVIQKTISDVTVFDGAFTLFATSSSYKQLARAMSESDYFSLLKGINDISSFRHFNEANLDGYEKVIDSENFRFGVLRSANTFNAFIHGFKKSFNLEPETDARVDFEISTTLPGCVQSVRLKIEHKNHELFQDRIHCLIGVNGVGKTQLLNGIIMGAAKKFREENINLPSVSFLDKELQVLSDDSSSIEFKNLYPGFSRVVTYTSDSESALPVSTSIGGFDYSFFNMSDSRKEFSYDKHLSYLLASIYRSDVSAGFDKWDVLEKSISGIAPIASLMIPVKDSFTENIFIVDNNQKKWVLIRNLNGEQRILDIFGLIDPDRDLCFLSKTDSLPIKLSSGQRSFFRFVLHFLTNAGMGTLLLIDEPETHLHPNLISEYMILLYRILEATQSIAIIATHSAYVVREAPRHCVHILRRSEQRPYVESVYMNTLGANVSDISMSVFGDNTVSNYHRIIGGEVSRSNQSLEKIIDKYRDLFSLDMLVEIRARIEGRDNSGGI